MNSQTFLQSFENLKSEVQELKTLQQRVLLHLENHNPLQAEIPSLTEEWISVKETCKILGCSDVTLWKLRKNGILSYSRLGRSIRFNKSHILNYLNQR